MNNVTISGRLTRDVKLGTSKSGKNYIINWLAVQRDKDTADFIKFIVWEHQAEYLSKYAKKGDKAVISGSLQVSQYESNGQKKEDYSVLARDVILMSANKKEESKQEEVVDNSSNDFEILESDLPF